MAYITVKAMSGVFGSHDIYLAVSALIWAVTAATVFRLGSTTASGIMILSVLCYFWANLTGAPRVVGSIPFVASDVLMVIAMVGIGWNGVAGLTDRALDMVRGGDRDGGRSGASANQAMPSQKTP